MKKPFLCDTLPSFPSHQGRGNNESPLERGAGVCYSLSPCRRGLG